MKYLLDPGTERRSINFVDNVVFSHVQNLQGNPMDLKMSLMLQNGNSEMRLASGIDDEVGTGKQPCVVWINGGGWKGVDKNLMAAECHFLAEAGFAVASPYYRSSAEGVFPAQLIDIKTAVRFLRAHADEYGIDADRIGVFGRSAGGHLVAWMVMNGEGYDGEEWKEFSSKVCCGVNMFGPTDIPYCSEQNLERFKNPNYRWHQLYETHEGCLLGATPETSTEEFFELGRKASPMYNIEDTMCPMIIMHGNEDPLVPFEVSVRFYDALQKAGLGDRVDFYEINHGGHGTREFFQPMTKQIVMDFFNKHMK